MSKVKITGHASGSGVLTVTAPNTSTDRTITLPDTTGTLLDENSSVPAANLTGTIADARFPATLPTASAANLTAIPAANITGTLPAISGANLTGISGGISEADQWRIHTDQGVQAGNYTITGNWERVDTANYEKIGTGMTEASGAFTFPSTGYWLIDHHLRGNQVTGATRYVFFAIQVSTDSGSSYTAATSGAICIPDAASGTDYACGNTKHILKVTNASTFRVLFNGNSAAYFVIDGHTNQTETSAIFMKLGDI